MSGVLPFSAVVGQDDAKLALLLAAKEPLLGGVLLRGDKGSAKTTLARSLAALLPGNAPFVELPLGATEDRVIGSIDLASLLRDGTPTVRQGLLAAADGGVLYVDEINLLADHLIDSLLDVAVSGLNRIERDGVTHQHRARFVLIGSMNPEEGELRPQLLDRFGFAVDVRASVSPIERSLAVRRRMAFDRGEIDHRYADDDQMLRNRLASEAVAVVPDSVVDTACSLAIAVGAEGLRADLMLCRGAAAHAAWAGRDVANDDDVRAVAGFVLAHRRRRSPLEPPGISQQELDDAFDEAKRNRPTSHDEPHAPDPSDGSTRTDPQVDSDPKVGTDSDADEEPTELDESFSQPNPPTRPADPPAPVGAPPTFITGSRRFAPTGRRNTNASPRGRFVRGKIPDARNPIVDASSVAVVDTAAALAERRAVEGRGADPSSSKPATTRSATSVQMGDLRVAVRTGKTGNLVILCVDASGSMGATQRMSVAKGAVLGLLTDAYQRRDRVALVTFSGGGASLVLRPTASIEIAQARMAELPTGGTSPIADGLDEAFRLAAGSSGDQALQPLVVVVTDGRATGSADAVERSRTSARRFAEHGIPCVVIDAESDHIALGLAGDLAELMGAPCLGLDQLVDGSLERTIRLRLA